MPATASRTELLPEPVAPLSTIIWPGSSEKSIGPRPISGMNNPLTFRCFGFSFRPGSRANLRPMEFASSRLRSKIGTSSRDFFSLLSLLAASTFCPASNKAGIALREIATATKKFLKRPIRFAAFISAFEVTKAAAIPNTTMVIANGRASSKFRKIPSVVTSPKSVT